MRRPVTASGRANVQREIGLRARQAYHALNETALLELVIEAETAHKRYGELEKLVSNVRGLRTQVLKKVGYA